MALFVHWYSNGDWCNVLHCINVEMIFLTPDTIVCVLITFDDDEVMILGLLLQKWYILLLLEIRRTDGTYDTGDDIWWLQQYCICPLLCHYWWYDGDWPMMMYDADVVVVTDILFILRWWLGIRDVRWWWWYSVDALPFVWWYRVTLLKVMRREVPLVLIVSIIMRVAGVCLKVFDIVDGFDDVDIEEYCCCWLQSVIHSSDAFWRNCADVLWHWYDRWWWWENNCCYSDTDTCCCRGLCSDVIWWPFHLMPCRCCYLLIFIPWYCRYSCYLFRYSMLTPYSLVPYLFVWPTVFVVTFCLNMFVPLGIAEGTFMHSIYVDDDIRYGRYAMLFDGRYIADDDEKWWCGGVPCGILGDIRCSLQLHLMMLFVHCLTEVCLTFIRWWRYTTVMFLLMMLPLLTTLFLFWHYYDAFLLHSVPVFCCYWCPVMLCCTIPVLYGSGEVITVTADPRYIACYDTCCAITCLQYREGMMPVIVLLPLQYPMMH